MGTAGAPSQCFIMLRRLWHQTGPVLTLTLMAEMNRRATNVEKSVEELEFLSGSWEYGTAPTALEEQ